MQAPDRRAKRPATIDDGSDTPLACAHARLRACLRQRRIGRREASPHTMGFLGLGGRHACQGVSAVESLGRAGVKDSKMFFGRLDILRRIDEELSDGSGPSQPVALWGQRRIGKTSILYQIERRSTGNYVPCLVDIQKVNPREPRVLFRTILREIHSSFWKVLQAEPPKSSLLKIVEIRVLRRLSDWF